jgi:GxxExxY protein
VKEECWLTTEGTEDTEGGEKGLNGISGSIIRAAIEVHRYLGPGMLESAYEACLEYELIVRGHLVERQKPLPVVYKGVPIDCAYRLDLVVDEQVIVEVKAVEHFLPIHQAQILSYLQLSGLHLGLLVNFNGATLRQGVRRVRPFQSFSVSSVPSVVKNS